MKLRYALIPLALLLVAFAILKESREPHLWLFVDDLLRPKPAPLEMAISPGLVGRLYADTRPHTGKIARLQKGLVLVADGKQVIEEGYGFGLPLVEVEGQAYNSRTASVERAGDALVKRFVMDTADTPSGFLRRKYEPVPSIGTVTVTYRAAGGGIDIEVDLGGLEVEWDRVFLMNEQGARHFDRYEEPGMVLEGEQLGRWQPTTSREGCIVAADRSLRFCVDTEEDIQRYFGRERYLQYYPVGIYALSWAGIDLELEPPTSTYQYHVRLEKAIDG